MTAPALSPADQYAAHEMHNYWNTVRRNVNRPEARELIETLISRAFTQGKLAAYAEQSAKEQS